MQGDVVTARYHARRAKVWNIVALAVGVLMAAFIITYNVADIEIQNS